MKDILIIANFCRDFSKNDNGRFMYLCKELSKDNRVEIITSDFNHSTKVHKESVSVKWPFKITFVHEPGYKKNISIQRFLSHYFWGNSVSKYLNKRKMPDVIYCAVPSLTAALRASEYCKKNNIKFIVDIQDLWPEAFQMVFNFPIIKNILFFPFTRIVNKIYSRADEICAVSQTYADRALRVNDIVKDGHCVFLGTRLETFDTNVNENFFEKTHEEIRVAYCGTLGFSYDISCVIDAISLLDNKYGKVRFIVMGDGPRRVEFEKYAAEKGIHVEFTGNLPYPVMCGRLKSCDIVVNPITHGAAQSIINKHADYAASGLPVLNTQECKEYCDLVDEYKMGFNCNNANDLADKLKILITDKKLRRQMGFNARKCAEDKFDRKHTYSEIIKIIENL